ncbi:MAG: AraC family transcriptional regulator [Betaproteobacteria bacterium]|nr:AraC family transcriptional regulator [Betaproteobacteria bacterium]
MKQSAAASGWTAALAGATEQWTQRVGALSFVPGLLRQLGVAPEPLLASGGLAPTALDHPDNRVPYSAVGRLFAESARRAGRPEFGLLAGRLWTLEHMGLVGQLMRHSPTLGDALRTLSVYHRLNSEGGAVFLRRDGDTVTLGYAIFQPRLEGVGHLYDGVMACGCNFVRELVGAHWRPLRVLLARAQPADSRPYREFFRAHVRFNSDHTGLHISAHLMDRPLAGADPHVLRALQAQIDAATAADLVVRLHRALRLLLLYGDSSGDHVAQQLTMHRRTLNRRLQAQGTTFQEVLDGVRWEIARQLLANTSVSLHEVAAATGYADTSTFVRAFRRWSGGTTPAKWRDDQGTQTALRS